MMLRRAQNNGFKLNSLDLEYLMCTLTDRAEILMIRRALPSFSEQN